MEIRNLQTFQAVAEELNLTKAAIKLNYSQPTVTKQIKSLEEQIGTDLIMKENGKYVLTPAGEILYQRTNVILSEIALISEIKAELGKKQTLELQSLDYFCYTHFVPAVKHALKKFPTTSYDIRAASVDDTFTALVKNELDLGITVGKMIPTHLDSAIIGYEKFILATSAKTAKNLKSKDYYINKYPVIVHRKAKYMYYNFFQQGLSLPTVIDCDSDEVIKESLLKGEILAIIGCSRIQKELDNGEVIALETLAEKEPIHLVKNNRKRNVALDCLYDYIIAPHRENYALDWGMGSS